MHPEARLSHLVAAVQELSLARTLDDVMQTVRREARRLTGADGATFVLREGGQCYYAEEDAIAPLWKGRRFPLEMCISGWVMLHHQPAVIPDIYADPRIPADAYRPTFVQSLVMVPIRISAPIGAIGTYWATQREHSAEEVQMLQALADSTSVALENVQVYQELEQRVQQRTQDLQTANAELRASLDRIQKLEKLVRMCAWTQRFELDGKWVDATTFLQKRFGVQVTHGISEEAMAAEMAHLRSAAPEPTAS